MQINNSLSSSLYYEQKLLSTVEQSQIDKSSDNKDLSNTFNEIKESNDSSNQDSYKESLNNVKAQLNNTASLNRSFLESLDF